MPKTKQQKQDVVAELNDNVKKMKSAVFINFANTSVKDVTELRNNCRKENVEYVVAKKTLLKKALIDNGYTIAQDRELSGEIASVFALKDEVSAARVINDFTKEHKTIKIVAGILEGKFVEVDQVIALAKLPSKQELIAKVVGSIAAPLSGMVNVLQGNLRNFVYALSAIRDKKA
ncbi:MAG: 50S ribosomal protein L10 [bacterium]